MSRYRCTKILVAAFISVIIGTAILKSLSGTPPLAGAFSLANYYSLEPVEKVISCRVDQLAGRRGTQTPFSSVWERWEHIEIYYSGHRTCNTNPLYVWQNQSTLLQGPPTPFSDDWSPDVDCHFVVCNGAAGSDGRIQATEKWLRQLSVGTPNAFFGRSGPLADGQTCGGGGQTIRICVMVPSDIAGSRDIRPTDFQIRRTDELVTALSRKFDIQPAAICYPDNW